MKVELYSKARADQFARMARDMHAESCFKDWPLDLNRLRSFIGSPGVFCALAIDDQQRAVGLILGNAGGFAFSPRQTADLQLLYVDPDHRGGRAAVMLVYAFESWAKAQGITDVHLSQRTGVHMAETSSFFQALGYRLTGVNATKGL